MNPSLASDIYPITTFVMNVLQTSYRYTCTVIKCLLFYFRLIEHRKSASSCGSLIPLVLELRPSERYIYDASSFFPPVDEVTRADTPH